MTALEKQIKVKEVLSRMCGYGDGCPDCDFFKPEDDTDGEFFCAIRDSEKLIPFDDDWNIGECNALNIKQTINKLQKALLHKGYILKWERIWEKYGKRIYC